MKRTHFLLIAVAIALTVLVIAMPLPHANDDKISELTFLTFEISDAGLTLVKWNTVPGAIKRARGSGNHGGIVYEAQTAAGTTLWEGSLDDPRIVRLESPDASGAMTAGIMRRETAQFTIRVPYSTMLDRVAFFAPRDAAKSGQTTQSLANLGNVAWPSTRQGRRP